MSTVMSTTPAPPAGDVAVICVDEFTVKLAALDPNFTAVAPLKSVPVMTTVVPPDGAPVCTLILVTVTGET